MREGMGGPPAAGRCPLIDISVSICTMYDVNKERKKDGGAEYLTPPTLFPFSRPRDANQTLQRCAHNSTAKSALGAAAACIMSP